MRSTLSTMAMVTGLISFSTYVSAWNQDAYYASEAVQSAAHYPAASQYQQASSHQDFQAVHPQSFSAANPRHNSLSAEQQLALYVRALDIEVEELIARGSTSSKIKSIGQKATKIAGKAANALGKAANIGKKVFGRDELSAWEDDWMYLAAREAEPEPEPELWAESDADVYGWDW